MDNNTIQGSRIVGHCALCGHVFNESSLTRVLAGSRSYELCGKCLEYSAEGNGPFAGADIGEVK